MHQTDFHTITSPYFASTLFYHEMKAEFMSVRVKLWGVIKKQDQNHSDDFKSTWSSRRKRPFFLRRRDTLLYMPITASLKAK